VENVDQDPVANTETQEVEKVPVLEPDVQAEKQSTPVKQEEKVKAEPLPAAIHTDAGKKEKPKKMKIAPEEDFVPAKSGVSGPKTP